MTFGETLSETAKDVSKKMKIFGKERTDIIIQVIKKCAKENYSF